MHSASPRLAINQINQIKQIDLVISSHAALIVQNRLPSVHMHGHSYGYVLQQLAQRVPVFGGPSNARLLEQVERAEQGVLKDLCLKLAAQPIGCVATQPDRVRGVGRPLGLVQHCSDWLHVRFMKLINL